MGGAKMQTLKVVFGIAMSAAAATPAFSACSEPSAPYCSTKYGAFDDEDEFHRCEREMQNYQSETKEFLACTKRKSDSVIQDYNSAVQSFNRRAQG
jgi:hypothetical protein